MLAYVLTIIYLAIDYLQPGVKSPAIAALRPALVVGTLLLIATLMYMASGRRRPVLFPLQSKLFLGLILFMAATLPMAFVKETALGTLQVMAINFGFYFILTQVIDTPAKLKGLLGAFVAIHVWVAIEGIRAFSSPSGEGPGNLRDILSKFLGNNNDFALALVVVFPFAFFLMLYGTSFLAKSSLVGCMLTFTAGIVITLSRGGQLGLLAVLGAIGIRSRRKAPFVVTLVCLGILVGAFAPSAFWRRMESIGEFDRDLQAQSRLYTWWAALNIAGNNPLFGVGPGNFRNVYGRQFADNRPAGVNPEWLTAHSVYFQLLAELGSLGLAIFIAMVLINLRTCNRIVKLNGAGQLVGRDGELLAAAAAACSASLVGFLVSGTFLSAGYYPHFWYLTAFVVIVESLALQAAPVRTQEMAASARPLIRHRTARAT